MIYLQFIYQDNLEHLWLNLQKITKINKDYYASIDTSLNHEREDITEFDCGGISAFEWIR